MVYEYTKPKGPIAAMYSSPGPCYGLPGLVGQKNHDPRSVHPRGASYMFGIRHGKFVDDCSPGPCYYPHSKVYRNGIDGTPHYSIYGRPKELHSAKTPGPGAYSPERSGPSAALHHPAYSFGTRHVHRRSEDTPAANAYALDRMIGKTARSGKPQAPIYSLSGRNMIGSFCEDLQKTPGPGAYNVTDPNLYRYSAPLYSMTSRNVLPGDTTQKPGPGAHSPERVRINKKTVPKFSFGIRHSTYITPLIIDVKDDF